MSTFEVLLRPMTWADLPSLARWLADPLVARWWSEYKPEGVEADFGSQLESSSMELFVVEAGGTAVGMLQRYPIGAFDEHVRALTDTGVQVPAGAWSIDYFIGVPSIRGHGLGASMVACAVSAIWVQTTATCVIVPVHEENTRSWRALLKAGFTRLPGMYDLDPDNLGDSRRHVVCRADRV